LTEAERRELEESIWIRLFEAGNVAEDNIRREAERQLASDPEAAGAKRALGVAELVRQLTFIARDSRFDALGRELRPIARAFAARAYVRALQLEAGRCL